jgi:trehalose 6-phosphate phosphatase
MRHILARANIDILRQFAWSKVLLAFDYDGTLAPITDDPASARIQPGTLRLFRDVARRYPCVVISGRSHKDICRHLAGVDVAAVIGNHGIDLSRYDGPLLRRVRGWIIKLERDLAGLRGVVIEDKVVSVAVHYRQSRAKRRAALEILQAAEGLGKVRIIRGKLVFNLLPEGAPHKGMALQSARDRLGCDTAIYLGDDEADEDVFALDEPGRLLGVRIEESATSHAGYFLRHQEEIDELFTVLLSCRAEVGRGRISSRRADHVG